MTRGRFWWILFQLTMYRIFLGGGLLVMLGSCIAGSVLGFALGVLWCCAGYFLYRIVGDEDREAALDYIEKNFEHHDDDPQ